jgi:dihydroxyacetone kinase
MNRYTAPLWARPSHGGGLFASPSIDAILAAMLHTAGEAGVFAIVKAYTGDCLNFGLAIERARALGVRVDLIIFSDDIAIPDHRRPRGLAGTVLLERILGHCTESGASLAEIQTVAESVSGCISTLVISISSCSLPDSPNANRIAGGHAELGLGLHVEPGVEIPNTQNVGEIVNIMTERLNQKHRGPLAVLLNNFGAVSNLDMGIIARELPTRSGRRRCADRSI